MSSFLKKSKLKLLALGLCVSTSAFAQDDVDSTMNAKNVYERTDRLLNIEYQELKRKHEGQALDTLKARQVSWVASRNQMWGDPLDDSDLPRGESLQEKLNNLYFVTLSRIEYLKAYTGDNVIPGIAGDYTDSMGGQLTITRIDRENEYSVSLSVVRGRGLSNGFENVLLRLAPNKDNIASGRIRTPEGCTVDFKRVNHLIQIKEIEGCDHGFNANYDGDYLKVNFKGVD